MVAPAAAHQEQTAERPVGLSAERAFRLLLDHDDAPARVGELGGRCQPGKAAPDDDHIRIHGGILREVDDKT